MIIDDSLIKFNLQLLEEDISEIKYDEQTERIRGRIASLYLLQIIDKEKRDYLNNLVSDKIKY
jgi:hypothetical protein